MLDQETLETFDKLYNETYKDVLKYVVCSCSNIEDVKDIVQTIYLEVLKKMEKKNVSNLTKPYIMGITKNKVNGYYRFNYKAKMVSLFSKQDNEEDIELIDTIPDEFDLQIDLIRKDDIMIIWDFLKRKKQLFQRYFICTIMMIAVLRTLQTY